MYYISSSPCCLFFRRSTHNLFPLPVAFGVCLAFALTSLHAVVIASAINEETMLWSAIIDASSREPGVHTFMICQRAKTSAPPLSLLPSHSFYLTCLTARCRGVVRNISKATHSQIEPRIGAPARRLPTCQHVNVQPRLTSSSLLRSLPLTTKSHIDPPRSPAQDETWHTFFLASLAAFGLGDQSLVSS